MNNDPNISILIIDDSVSFADVLTQQLNKFGYERITHANSASEAIDTLNSQSFDLVFVDIVMPETNGIELTETIRAVHKKLKIVTMSSLAQEKIIIDSISAGANDFIQKPMSDHILESILDRMIKSKKD